MKLDEKDGGIIPGSAGPIKCGPGPCDSIITREVAMKFIFRDWDY